jgi:hypothetical protein
MQAAIDAVAEVGNPTIVATLTVVAALLPMLFVSGMMGPYMSADPGQCLGGDDLFLLRRGDRHALADDEDSAHGARTAMATPWRHGGWLGVPIGGGAADPAPSAREPGGSCWSTVATLGLAGAVLHQGRDGEAAALRQQVGAAVVIDLPEGLVGRGDRPRAAGDVAIVLAGLPESVSVQTYAGTAAPFNFNGLVRHSYLRAEPQHGRRADQPGAQGRPRPGEP